MTPDTCQSMTPVGISLEMRAAIDACAHGVSRGLEAVAEREAAMLRTLAEHEATMLRAVQDERDAAMQALADREADLSAGHEAPAACASQ